MDRRRYEELLSKLRRVQAVYLRPGTEGEKQAAAHAIQKLQYRLTSLRKYESLTVRDYIPQVFTKN